MAEYILARGGAGQRRLEILNEAMWPSSQQLLQRAGLQPGMSFLDVGCGAGELTSRVAKLGVHSAGVDVDPGFVEAAHQRHPEIPFTAMSVLDLPSLGRSFDVVYARYLLAHLANPADALKAMMSVAKPGGTVIVEDVDFDLHTAEPRPAAFDRYLELYKAVILRRGGDAFLGRRLFALAREAGLEEVEASVQISVFTKGEPKRISSLTLDGVREPILRDSLATEEELEGLLRGLRTLEDDPGSLISVAGTHQVFGRVSGANVSRQGSPP